MYYTLYMIMIARTHTAIRSCVAGDVNLLIVLIMINVGLDYVSDVTQLLDISEPKPEIMYFVQIERTTWKSLNHVPPWRLRRGY